LQLPPEPTDFQPPRQDPTSESLTPDEQQKEKDKADAMLLFCALSAAFVKNSKKFRKKV
jgi:hypothetical protein